MAETRGKFNDCPVFVPRPSFPRSAFPLRLPPSGWALVPAPVSSLEQVPICLRDRPRTLPVMMHGERHDDWFGSQGLEFCAADRPVLQIPPPLSAPTAAQFRHH